MRNCHFAERGAEVRLEKPKALEVLYFCDDGNYSVHFSKDGRLYLAGQTEAFWWSVDMQTKEPIGKVTQEKEFILSICTDPSDDTVVIVTSFHRVNVCDEERILHQWRCHRLKSYAQATIMFSKIVLIDSAENAVVFYNKMGRKLLTLHPENFNKAWFTAKYDSNNLIISGASGIGKFPVQENSAPEWVTDITAPRGVCVDHTGLIYAASQMEAVYVLSPAGKITEILLI